MHPRCLRYIVVKENILPIGSSEFYHWIVDWRSNTRESQRLKNKRTITGLELVITRCWDGFAVHVRTVGRFEIDDKRPIRLSVRIDSEGKW